MSDFTGISDSEAQALLKKYGPNEIKDLHKVSPFTILFRQIKKNFIIYLLVLAALISFFVGKAVTAYTILAVIFMVIFIGFIQEYRAEKAISSLKKMIMPVTIVIRGGKKKEIPSSELVPGDIIILGNGEKIPADCRVLDESELRVNESALTGESREVEKVISKSGANLTEDNMLFMGTFIVNGRCTAQVVHTGMNTKFGNIAGMISSAEKALPLQDKINQISKYMAIVAIVVSVLTGGLMYLRADIITPEVITGILILVIALSVSAFPEGFPVVLITTLATGAASMAKKNAIVNRMSIIETLGETTIICSDKTGTLTKGEMTVRKIFIESKFLEVTGSGFEGKGNFLIKDKELSPQHNPGLLALLKAAIICNDSKIERTGEDMEYKVSGTPTEGSLMILGAKANLFIEDLNIKRVEEAPFSSDRKMMSVLASNGETRIYSKGAVEVLLEKCSFVLKDGKKVTLSPQEKKAITDANSQMNTQALRTLAVAYKDVAHNEKNISEEQLIFLGFVGIEDPPREEAAEAIKQCALAGIKVKMITGDNKETALSIASQIGLSGKALEGKELDLMSDEELSVALEGITIFARVRPEHKLRIVKLLKQKGEIVTMTGDGVNDAPALKEAHIGVAMGKNGTDVSRSVADLTLKDDNFATIVAAIKEGRTIFNNIRKFVSYQLSCNIAELSILLFGVLLSPFFGWEVPLLLSLHILFMNLVTDNLPAITLGFNPSSKDIMNERPRKDTRIISKPIVFLILFNGALMAIFTLGIYFIFYNLLGQNVEISRTAALAGLILLEIASAFNFRSFRKKTLSRSPFVNKYLFFASLISIMATLIILYTDANKAFETVPLDLYSWIVLAAPALLIILIYDLIKDYSHKTGELFAHLT